MRRQIDFVSVVIPFFNEEENVRPVIGELSGVLRISGIAHEIVAVDDGSSDGTWERLRELKDELPEMKLVRLRSNFGQTKAMTAGIQVASGEWIITMDGDGQNDPHSIPALIHKASEGYDAVSGWRKNRKDSKILRTIPSRICNAMIASLTGLSLHDSGCSLKIYRAKALRSISLYSDRHRFIPFLLAMRAFRVAEVVVNHRPRVRGKSKYGFSRTLKVVLDVLSLALFAKFSEAPRLYFFLASVPFAAGLAFSARVAVEEVRRAPYADTTSSLIAFGAIFLFGFGVVSLVTCGLIAEWMNHFERGKKHAA